MLFFINLQNTKILTSYKVEEKQGMNKIRHPKKLIRIQNKDKKKLVVGDKKYNLSTTFILD